MNTTSFLNSNYSSNQNIPFFLYNSLPAICMPSNTDALVSFDYCTAPKNIATKVTPNVLTYNNPNQLVNVVTNSFKFGNGSLELKLDSTKTNFLAISNFIPNTTTGFSCSIWFRYTQLQGQSVIFMSDNVIYFGRNGAYGLYFTSSSTIRLLLGWNSGNNLLFQDFNIATYGISNNGNWNHIAYSISTTGAVILLINGIQATWTAGTVLYASGGITMAGLNNGVPKSYNFCVGSSSYVLGNNLSGNVDQLRLYNATLTLAELQSIYNNGC